MKINMLEYKRGDLLIELATTLNYIFILSDTFNLTLSCSITPDPHLIQLFIRLSLPQNSSRLLSNYLQYILILQTYSINNIFIAVTYIPMEYCDNCDKNLPQEKFDLHLGYCRRNIKKCPDCKLPYDINQQEQHRQEHHKHATCKYCSKEFKESELQLHQEKCTEKPIMCAHCDLNIPKQLFEQHVAHCEARTEVCEKCFKPIKKKEFEQHYSNCYGPIQGQENLDNSVYSSGYSGYVQENSQLSSPLKYTTNSNSFKYSGGSSSFSSYQPSNGEKVISTTRNYEPRVISRRIISGPNAGKQLPVEQPIEKVERQTYVDPKTGATSIRTVTTKQYYRVPSKNQQNAYSYQNYSVPASTYYGQGAMGGLQAHADYDPQLQAALMASLGYGDPAQIQQQRQIQKQIKKK